MNRIKQTIAGLTILGASLLPGCSGGPVVQPPIPNPSNPECLEDAVSAVSDAAALGLDIDVSVFDSSENRSDWEGSSEACYTVHEQEMVHELARVRSEGATVEALESIVADHPHPGPAIVQALGLSWDGFVKDSQYDPSLEFYANGRLGWIPLDIITGTRMPGKGLQDAGHTSIYPFDQDLESIGLADYDEREGHTSTFVEERGLDCIIDFPNEDYPEVTIQASGDFIYSEGYDNGTPIAILIRSGMLDGAVVDRITVTRRYDPLIGEYDDGSILVRNDIHPDDSSLLGYSSRSISSLSLHLTPDVNKQFFSKEEFPVSEGQTLQTGDDLGYVNLFLSRGAGPIFDLTYFVRERLDHGPTYVEHMNLHPLDPFNFEAYPKRLSPTPTEPRYGDLKNVFGCE